LHLAAGAVVLPTVSHIAGANPSVAPGASWMASAGRPTDIAARLIGQSLSERLGQSFVIENRPGAGSNIGTEAVVVRSRTAIRFSWLFANAINATLYDKLNFNFIRDIAPVAALPTASP
jgi:tripartite-type tricarboxylate transporter receptor subunit TctC